MAILNRPDVDGRFYEIAMSFLVNAGHISPREPEYVNYCPEQIWKEANLEINQKKLLHLFDNISLLFEIRQCMFFSIELLSSKKQRSQDACNIHKFIHSFVETDASVCFFKYDNEIMLSFIGYGIDCVLSDWFSENDEDGELTNRLDISNTSLRNNKEYFSDLAYSLERTYYHYTSTESIYYMVPFNARFLAEKGEMGKEDLQEIIKTKMEAVEHKYGDDLVDDESFIIPQMSMDWIVDYLLFDLDAVGNSLYEEGNETDTDSFCNMEKEGNNESNENKREEKKEKTKSVEVTIHRVSDISVSNHDDNKVKDIILSTLSEQKRYISLSEIYDLTPQLAEYKWKDIINAIRELVNNSVVTLNFMKNKRGSMEAKYRVKD